jgi:hypothetical protein
MYKVFLLSELCVNTLPATKITIITNGIYLGSLRVNVEMSSVPWLNCYKLYLFYGLYNEAPFDIM